MISTSNRPIFNILWLKSNVQWRFLSFTDRLTSFYPFGSEIFLARWRRVSTMLQIMKKSHIYALAFLSADVLF